MRCSKNRWREKCEHHHESVQLLSDFRTLLTFGLISLTSTTYPFLQYHRYQYGFF